MSNEFNQLPFVTLDGVYKIFIFLDTLLDMVHRKDMLKFLPNVYKKIS